MNIKSILLGSAAALVAVSGARAADAVVMVEPEPVEYVRVCDVYGTGFFYIPGTETCLKISGYLRMRMEVAGDTANSDLDDAEINENGDVSFDDDYRFRTRVRARLDFDAREETELGTLRAKIRVQATNTGNGFGTGDAGFGMAEGYLQLGGLTVGYLDSVWAGDDGGIGDGLFTDNDWSVGDYTQNRISYTYASNGFSGTLSLEDDGTGDFIPDVVAKLAYTGGWGGAYITGVFDEETFSETYDTDPIDANSFGSFGLTTGFGGFAILAEDYQADDSAFALKAGVMLENLIAEDSAFKIEGHYAFDPTEYAVTDYVFSGSVVGRSLFTAIPSEWQIGAGYQQQFGKLFAAVSGVYGETFDLQGGTFDGFGLSDDFAKVDISGGEYYGVALNLGYDITSNLSVLGEVSYRNVDFGDTNDDIFGERNTFDGDIDQTAGFLEIKRTF